MRYPKITDITYGPETHAQACIRRGDVDCKGCGGGVQRRTTDGDWVCNTYPECAAARRLQATRRYERPTAYELAMQKERER